MHGDLRTVITASGVVLSSLLGSLVVDGLLRKINGADLYSKTYVNDLIIHYSETTAKLVGSMANGPL